MGPSIILSERLEGAGRKGGRSPLCALYLKRKVLSILYMSPTAARLLRDIPTAKKCLAEPLRRLPPTTRKPPFPYLWRVLGVVRGRVAGRRATQALAERHRTRPHPVDGFPKLWSSFPKSVAGVWGAS